MIIGCRAGRSIDSWQHMGAIGLKPEAPNHKSKVFKRKGHRMKTSSTTTNTKSNLEEVFALWESKKGDKVYFTGKTAGDKPIRVVAFINESKKNEKEPDIHVYEQAPKGEKKTQIASLWQNKSKSGKDYFSGLDNENKKIVGFINDDTMDGKYPSIRVYYSDNK